MRVALDPDGQVGREFVAKREPLCRGGGLVRGGYVLDHFAEGEGRGAQLNFTRLDLGEVEDVINHTEQVLAARGERLQ